MFLIINSKNLLQFTTKLVFTSFVLSYLSYDPSLAVINGWKSAKDQKEVRFNFWPSNPILQIQMAFIESVPKSVLLHFAAWEEQARRGRQMSNFQMLRLFAMGNPPNVPPDFNPDP